MLSFKEERRKKGKKRKPKPFDLKTFLAEQEAYAPIQPAERVSPEDYLPPPDLDLLRIRREEFVVKKNGEVRQAGAEPSDPAAFVKTFKAQAEQNLFVFARGVMGKWWLIPPLHTEACHFLTDFSKKRRKLLLLPREHGKTTLVLDVLPAHILIQPTPTLYGLKGEDQRILICGEKIDNAKDHIRPLKDNFEGNPLLRALWPERFWPGKPSLYTTTWNSEELILPRSTEYPDPTIRGTGVGGAVAGKHPSILIKDDLISFEAAQSVPVMQRAIEWHEASRNMIDGQKNALEFIIGTRWAVQDLYGFIIDNDETVQVCIRSAIEQGAAIYNEDEVARHAVEAGVEIPEGKSIGFTLQRLLYKKRTEGTLFLLNYMNDASSPDIVDFPLTKLRFMTDKGAYLTTPRTYFDDILAEAAEEGVSVERTVVNRTLSPELIAQFIEAGDLGALARMRFTG